MGNLQHFCLVHVGSPKGFRVSTKSFLFGFEKTMGPKPKELVLGLDQVSKVIRWSKDRGPIFGFDELVLSSDMTQAHTSELTTYIDTSPKTNKSILLRGESVYLHAIEVLTIGGEWKIFFFFKKYYINCRFLDRDCF